MARSSQRIDEDPAAVVRFVMPRRGSRLDPPPPATSR
jgi:hypothetical protein